MKIDKKTIFLAALLCSAAAGLSAGVTLHVVNRGRGVATPSDGSPAAVQNLHAVVSDAEDVEEMIVQAQGHAHDPGQEDSPDPRPEFCQIKSLTADEIQAYQQGTGNGTAKAAERNHYPGPRHVLDLAHELQLTEDQTRQLQAIEDVMHVAAISADNRLIEIERRLNGAFADKRIDPARLASLVEGSATLQARLRLTHLYAHLQTQKVLSAAQIEKYDELRGYKNAKNRCTGSGSQNTHVAVNHHDQRALLPF